MILFYICHALYLAFSNLIAFHCIDCVCVFFNFLVFHPFGLELIYCNSTVLIALLIFNTLLENLILVNIIILLPKVKEGLYDTLELFSLHLLSYCQLLF